MSEAIHVPDCCGERLQVRETLGVDTRAGSGRKRGRLLRRRVGVECDGELIGKIDIVCERLGNTAGNERQYGRNQQEAPEEDGRHQIKINRLRSLAFASSQTLRDDRFKLLCEMRYRRKCLCRQGGSSA